MGHQPQQKTTGRGGGTGNAGRPEPGADPLFGPLPGPTVPPRHTAPVLPAAPDPGQPEPGQPEPGQPEPGQPEPSRESPSGTTPGTCPHHQGPTTPPHVTAPLPVIPAAGHPGPGERPPGSQRPDLTTPAGHSGDQSRATAPLPVIPAAGHPDSDEWPPHGTAPGDPDGPDGPDAWLPGSQRPDPTTPAGHSGDQDQTGQRLEREDEWDGWDERIDRDPAGDAGDGGEAGEAGEATGRVGPQRRVFRIVAALAAATLAVTVGITVMARGDDKSTREGTAQDAGPAAPPVPPGFIDSARTDKDPVVADEFFGAERATVSGNVYQRLAHQLDNGCPQLTGDLTTILADGKCRQLVRALYATGPVEGQRQVLVGVSVFVLDDKGTAQAVKDAVTAGKGGVTPLAVPQGSVPGIAVPGPAGDNSWRAATARGHYSIFLQAAYVDGTEGAATDERLRNVINDMQLLAIDPIATRTIVGHGPQPRATATPTP